MLWAYLHCYQLTLDTYTPLQQGGSTDEPTVVYHENSNSVVQMNAAAKQHGIELGFGLAQTAALCPQAHIIKYDKDVEKQALLSLAHQLYPLASDIVINTEHSLAIRLDNLLQYYGGYDVLWNTLTHEINQQGIHYHYATAWGIEAARVLAKSQINQMLRERTAITKCLAHCKLSYTDLDSKALNALEKVGITSIGQLLTMPVHELGRRFTNDTIRYLTALRGETFPTRTLFRPSSTFKQHTVLPFEVENSQHLLPYMGKLLDTLSHYLRARNLTTSSLCFEIQLRETEQQVMPVSAATPFTCATAWLDLVSLKVERLVLQQPAIALTLLCEDFEPIEKDTNDLFSDRFTHLAQKQLIGRLKAKLGEQSTQLPALGNSHIFEKMTVYQAQGNGQSYGFDAAPTFLLDHPKPLSVASRVCFGPLRLQTGWWEENTQKQDYFIAQTPQGVRLLVFKDTESKWWVQGVYS